MTIQDRFLVWARQAEERKGWRVVAVILSPVLVALGFVGLNLALAYFVWKSVPHAFRLHPNREADVAGVSF